MGELNTSGIPDQEFLSEKHKALFLDIIRIAHSGEYSHISNTSFDSLFQLSQDIIHGIPTNITLNIGVGGIQEKPSIVLPGYILGGIKMLEKLTNSVSEHYENCTIRLRVHIAMNEAITYNNYQSDITRTHGIQCIHMFQSFVKKYFPNMSHLIYFDFSEITIEVQDRIQEINNDIGNSTDTEFMELKKKLEKMGERHGSDKGKENALLYAIIHTIGLHDIPHTATVDPTFHDLDNHYHISAGGKAEQNFNLLRSIIRDKYGISPVGKTGDMHLQFTSEKYLKPPYYQDKTGDIALGTTDIGTSDILSKDRMAQLQILTNHLQISEPDYLNFISNLGEELNQSNIPDLLNMIQNPHITTYFQKNPIEHLPTAKSSLVKIDISNTEAISNFLSQTEQSIIDRGFLPYHFDEKSKTPEGQIELMKYGVNECIGEVELLKKLKEGKDIVVKFGIDPTGDEIHIGHLIPIKHLRLFQALGYQIRFLIGTFTATIGDPDKKTTRQVLSSETIAKNIETYLDQVGLVLDRNHEKMQVVYNKDWYGKWGADDLLGLAMKGKVGQMLQKQQFADRLKEEQSISVGEFIYPLLQGWDSVVLDADVELGGTDQKFNLLMGRSLQSGEGKTPQTVITFGLLNGFDGRKMSKTFDNYVGIKPQDNIQAKISNDYGKLLSMTDEQMGEYFKYVVSTSPTEQETLSAIWAGNQINPMIIKKMLARTILRLFYTSEQVKIAEDTFTRVVSGKEAPDEMPIISLNIIENASTPIDIIYQALEKLELLGIENTPARISKTELRRRIKAGGILVNNVKLVENITLTELGVTPYIVRYGKNKFITIN